MSQKRIIRRNYADLFGMVAKREVKNTPKVIRLAETKDLPFMPRRFR